MKLMGQIMDMETLTVAELDGLRIEVLTEQERRRLIADAPAQAAALAERYAAAIGRQDGDPWQQPAGAHDAYRQGATVIDGGKTWESTVANNVHAPGVSGWREKVADGGRAAWVQPAGAHDAYRLDAEVTHNGRAWLNTYPSNSYEPGVYGWTDLGPA